MIAAWIQRFLSEDKLWYRSHLSFKRGLHVPWFTGECMQSNVKYSVDFSYIDHHRSFQKCGSSYKLVIFFVVIVKLLLLL